MDAVSASGIPAQFLYDALLSKIYANPTVLQDVILCIIDDIFSMQTDAVE